MYFEKIDEVAVTMVSVQINVGIDIHWIFIVLGNKKVNKKNFIPFEVIEITLIVVNKVSVSSPYIDSIIVENSVDIDEVFDINFLQIHHLRFDPFKA